MNKETKISVSSVAAQAKFLVPALCLASALTASAVNYTWAGGTGGGDWGVASNWSPSSGTPTTSADVAFFGAASSGNSSTVTVSSSFSVSALNLASNTGATVTLNASGGTRTITVGGGSSQFRQNTVLNNIVLTKTSGNSFNLFGGLATLTLNNGSQWNYSGGSGSFNTQADRLITSTAGSGSISVASGSTLTVSGGDFTATVQNGAGSVSFGSSGLINMNRGTLALASTSTLGGTVDFNGTTGGTTATLRNSGTLTANNLTVSKTGSNTALLENTGGTFTLAGTLALNAPMTVSGGALSGVTTSASGSGAVTVSGSGSVTPAGASVGTINLPGGLSFTGGSYSVNITTGGGADRITAGGAVSLGGGLASLSVSSQDVTDGTVFTILSGSSLSGTFASLPDGSTVNGGAQSYTINYTGTQVNLTAVPEPQFYAGAVGLGLLGFTVWRRQQKRA